MSWEAFWGALLPSVVTMLAAIAAYFRARAAEAEAKAARLRAEAAHADITAQVSKDIELTKKNGEIAVASQRIVQQISDKQNGTST